MVMSFDVALIYLRSLFIAAIQGGAQRTALPEVGTWTPPMLMSGGRSHYPMRGWAVSNELARWQVDWAHHSECQSDRNDKNQDRHETAASEASDASATPALDEQSARRQGR